MVNWTVTRRPFQSPVALAMSSPTFLGDYEVEKEQTGRRVSGWFGWSFRVERLGTHKTQRTDLGGQSGRSSDLTSGGSEVDDLYVTKRETIDRQFPGHASKAESQVRKSGEEVEVDVERDKAVVRRARRPGEGESREDERQVHVWYVRVCICGGCVCACTYVYGRDGSIS